MFPISSNGNNSEPNFMTIIDETETITTQKNKQVFSPKQSFPPKPYVEVPMPDNLIMEEFMPKKPGGKKTSNAFIIYRTVFTKVLMKQDYQNKMTDVSKMAADSWRIEKAELITAYKNFANEIQLTHKKRSQDAKINRTRRLIAATTPRENPAPISVPVNPQRHEIHETQAYQQLNLITEHPINFPYDLPFPQVFNPGSNDSLISILAAYNEFGQSPMPSSIGEVFPSYELNGDLDALAISPFLFYPETQSTYGNNDPSWVYRF